jgi:DNA polymerase III subunit delta
VEHRPAYLIAGSDWPKVDAAAARLRGQFDSASIVQLAVGEDDERDVVAECNALDLLGGERLVLVRNAEQLEDGQIAAIVEYLKDPAPGTCLALFGAGGIGEKDPLAKAVAKVGDVRIFDAPDRKRAADWVVKRFAESGARCPLPVARRLVELAGEDIGDLALEVEKVATYASGGDPTVEDVELLVIPQPDVKPWDITDAWGRRDAASVIRLTTAEIEQPGDLGRTVGQLASHIRKVRRALLVMEAGGTVEDVQKDQAIRSSFTAGKLCDQARRFSDAELGRAIVRLAALDLAVKGGSRLDPRLELELALAELTTG